MEIIKQGNLNLAKAIRTFRCDKCGCVFKAEKGEYQIRSHYNDTLFVCECPTCHVTAYEENHLEFNWQHMKCTAIPIGINCRVFEIKK